MSWRCSLNSPHAGTKPSDIVARINAVTGAGREELPGKTEGGAVDQLCSRTSNVLLQRGPYAQYSKWESVGPVLGMGVSFEG